MSYCSYFSSWQEGVLLQSFSDLRQLLDLFVSWDWSTYLADKSAAAVDRSGAAKYNRVKPEAALAVLEKLREAEKKGVLASAMMNKREKDKRKLVDTVYSQLRGLVAGSRGGIHVGS